MASSMEALGKLPQFPYLPTAGNDTAIPTDRIIVRIK